MISSGTGAASSLPRSPNRGSAAPRRPQRLVMLGWNGQRLRRRIGRDLLTLIDVFCQGDRIHPAQIEHCLFWCLVKCQVTGVRQEAAGTAMPLFPVDRIRHGPDRRFGQIAGLSGRHRGRGRTWPGRPPSARVRRIGGPSSPASMGSSWRSGRHSGFLTAVRMFPLTAVRMSSRPDGCPVISGSRSESGTAQLLDRMEELTGPPPRPGHRSGRRQRRSHNQPAGVLS